jgi:hypothetical protein
MGSKNILCRDRIMEVLFNDSESYLINSIVSIIVHFFQKEYFNKAEVNSTVQMFLCGTGNYQQVWKHHFLKQEGSQ